MTNQTVAVDVTKTVVGVGIVTIVAAAYKGYCDSHYTPAPNPLIYLSPLVQGFLALNLGLNADYNGSMADEEFVRASWHKRFKDQNFESGLKSGLIGSGLGMLEVLIGYGIGYGAGYISR